MTNMCQKVALAGAATVAVAATIIMAKSASAQSAAICQSINFQPARCSMDTRRGVVLERVLSRTPCIRGRDWDYRPGFVWVTNGCRAQFRSGGSWFDRDRSEFPEQICVEEEVYIPRSRQRVRYPRRIPCPY
ncbi:DUF3011 domain-containing protein [Phormidium sp. LEGE 05292]|uniref:DUF3011 domain-containing protein n=1 Tax=[Phormidium] sp. LEGE 05292 TaxID=767427 RepID=UPI00187F4AAD|nr:DUF3011 domain-containing protein [Phormidium sp. LEGE 05292]MBE9223971.1 DUF3011 domain-containing protein [Phormidium sp. LEGE 05292]